jgi:hypothetical protein
MNSHTSLRWRKARNTAFALGIAASIGCAVLAAGDLDTFLHGYLFAFLSACFISAGCFGLLAVGNLTGGRWAIASRPLQAAGVDTTLLVVLLFVPVGLGVEHIYVWASGEGQPMFEGSKAAWLSTRAFLGRAAAYLVIWLLLSILLVRFSRLDRVPGETVGMRRVGAFCLVTFVLVMTLAAFDWGMSLEPEWYSSIYGAILAISGVVAAHSLFSLLLGRLTDEQIWAPFGILEHPPEAAHGADLASAARQLRGDMASLLLAIVMLWAYFSFSQLLIIWAGNLPAEISWYLPRIKGNWEWLAVGIAALHFVVPFLLLLSRRAKESPGGLAAVALLLLAMYVVNLFWMIKPAFSPERFAVSAADAVCLLAAGGLWTGTYLWRLESRWAAGIDLGSPAGVVHPNPMQAK